MLASRKASLLLEFEYEREPVRRRTPTGHEFMAWRPTAVPRIADEMLQSVFYLYPSREAAEKGQAAGGTAFIVAYVSEKVPNAYFLFAVSNKHVIADSGASVVRLNKIDGGVDILEFEPHEWHFTNQHDLAIIPIKVDLALHRVKAIALSDFVTPAVMSTYDIGPGDEVFMIGRFVKHDGRLINAPSVRFGNLSMMVDSIEHPTLGSQESFAVEMRSMGGYSGSPVYVYPSQWNMNTGTTVIGGQHVFLLGVDWGHIVDHSVVKEKIVNVQTQALSANERSVAYVTANTGMNGVVPAWRLTEMIKKNPWSEAIESEEKKMVAEQVSSMSGVALDSVAPLANDENPKHREDFTSLLNAAARKPELKD